MLNSTAESQLDARKILRAEYNWLGVFLDSRCDRREYTRILVDVSNLLVFLQIVGIIRLNDRYSDQSSKF